MRGVCVDGKNTTARPSPEKLYGLSPKEPGARLVLFNDVEFYGYYADLYRNDVGIAVVMVGESDFAGNVFVSSEQYAEVLKPMPPDMLIVGNEMNALSEAEWETQRHNFDEPYSSQAMGHAIYIEYWGLIASAWKDIQPDVPRFVGGNLGGPAWLNGVWDRLNPRPDGIVIHYPDSEETIESYKSFGVPLCIGEYSYQGKGATYETVADWQKVLERHCFASFWFPWSLGQLGNPGALVTVAQRPRITHKHYSAAIRAAWNS